MNASSEVGTKEYNEGAAACLRGTEWTECPYEPHTAARKAWQRGHFVQVKSLGWGKYQELVHERKHPKVTA